MKGNIAYMWDHGNVAAAPIQSKWETQDDTRWNQFCRSETKFCTMHAHPCLQASPAHSLVVSEQYVFCGCSEGVVRIFDPCTLDYLITVPKPHSLGVDVAAALDSRCVGVGMHVYVGVGMCVCIHVWVDGQVWELCGGVCSDKQWRHAIILGGEGRTYVYLAS